MPTEQPTESSITKAAIQLNLTAAGWVVVAMMIASLFLSGTSRIAVGFLIPLGAAIIIDLFVSWLFLSQQSISMVPSRTVTSNPDAIPVRVTSTGGTRPIRVTFHYPGSVENGFGLRDEPKTVKLWHQHTGATNFVRANLHCTVLGLATAYRWQTHSLPDLHWAPAANTGRVPTPDALDEVARLREYVPGDRMSRVSWPVTARTGRMHVRAAGVGHEEITLIVNPGEVEPPEPTMILATTLASQLLEDGHQVRLVTTELNPDYQDELRRRAIADPRTDPLLDNPPAEGELSIVDRFVTDEDDLARRVARATAGPAISWPFPGAVDISPAGIESLA